MTISEPTWKRYKKIRLQALDRYCSAILDEARSVCEATDASSHERYLKLYTLIQERNDAMKMPFDGLSRSSAWVKVKGMIDLGLLTPEEIESLNELLLG